MTHISKLFALLVIPFVFFLSTACTQNESVANDSGVSFVNKDGSNPNVVAKFDGKEITVEELEKASPAVFDARLRVYQEQKRAVEDQVRNLVMDGLAKKANLSNEEFMR